MDEVFAFVALKPCGCVAQACTPHVLGETMRKKFFREQMAAGKIRTVKDREEWMKLPWKCAACKPAPVAGERGADRVMKKKTYVVEFPIRGYNVVVVEASSAREAKEKVDRGSRDVQGVDSHVTWHGKARRARLDKSEE